MGLLRYTQLLRRPVGLLVELRSHPRYLIISQNEAALLRYGLFWKMAVWLDHPAIISPTYRSFNRYFV